MRQKYHMTLFSPMGPREGILLIDETENEVSGTLDLLSHQNAVQGRRMEDGRFLLHHRIITAVNEYLCQSVLSDKENRLEGELTIESSSSHLNEGIGVERRTMHWSGERVK